MSNEREKSDTQKALEELRAWRKKLYPDVKPEKPVRQRRLTNPGFFKWYTTGDKVDLPVKPNNDSNGDK